jgi:hypothetical protein
MSDSVQKVGKGGLARPDKRAACPYLCLALLPTYAGLDRLKPVMKAQEIQDL